MTRPDGDVPIITAGPAMIGVVMALLWGLVPHANNKVWSVMSILWDVPWRRCGSGSCSPTRPIEYGNGVAPITLGAIMATVCE